MTPGDEMQISPTSSGPHSICVLTETILISV